MNEKQIRQIAQQVYQQMQTKNQFSSLKISRHVHNNIDSPAINSKDIIGFSQLSNSAGSVLAANNFNEGSYIQSTSGNTTVFTIPEVQFGNGGEFGGGTAPIGTILYATGGTYLTTTLWVCIDGTHWAGFQATLSA